MPYKKLGDDNSEGIGANKMIRVFFVGGSMQISGCMLPPMLSAVLVSTPQLTMSR